MPKIQSISQTQTNGKLDKCKIAKNPTGGWYAWKVITPKSGEFVFHSRADAREVKKSWDKSL